MAKVTTDLVGQNPSGAYDVPMMIAVNANGTDLSGSVIAQNGRIETDLIQQPATGGARPVGVAIVVNADGSPISAGGGGGSDTNFTAEEKQKLAGIQTDATKNATDANLLNRANHTGVQTASSIVDLPDVLATKLDAVPGKTLSDANFTQAEKDKLAGLEDAHFKGVHVGLAGLETAHPTGTAGDYAVVDDGTDLTWYQWDGGWVARTGESTEITPAQVKAYYESNPDTNAYTDAEKAIVASLGGPGRFSLRRVGTWNAATNTPQLLDGTGTNGDYYVVTTAGTQYFGPGNRRFEEYDWVFFAGGVWNRLPAGNTPASVVNWSDVQGKPSVLIKRGTISPPIPALRMASAANQSIPASTYQIISNWSNGYDIFGIHAGGGKFIMPAWVNHARVCASVYFDPLQADKFIRLRVYKNGTLISQGNAWGAGDGNYLAPYVDTGVIPVSPDDELDLRIWHNGTSARTIYNSFTDMVNIELFEAQ